MFAFEFNPTARINSRDQHRGAIRRRHDRSCLYRHHWDARPVRDDAGRQGRREPGKAAPLRVAREGDRQGTGQTAAQSRIAPPNNFRCARFSAGANVRSAVFPVNGQIADRLCSLDCASYPGNLDQLSRWLSSISSARFEKPGYAISHGPSFRGATGSAFRRSRKSPRMGQNPLRRLRRSVRSRVLPQAEEAVRARPDDGVILLLAATAALLDQNPERAQVFLKRFAKRYRANDPYHLLHALVLAQEGRLGSARSELNAHELGDRFEALQNFPGGWTRREWLFREHDRIFGRGKAAGGKRKVADVGRRRSKARPRASRVSRAPRARRCPRRNCRPTRAGPARAAADRHRHPVHRRARSRAAAGRPAAGRRKATAAGTGCASASPISASRKASTNCSACRI